MEAPQPFRILPHLLQQAAYQVIVEEVFGLQEVTRPSQNSPEPNCPNSQNSVRKRTGGRPLGRIGTPRTDEKFSYIWKRANSRPNALTGQRAGYAPLKALLGERK